MSNEIINQAVPEPDNSSAGQGQSNSSSGAGENLNRADRQLLLEKKALQEKFEKLRLEKEALEKEKLEKEQNYQSLYQSEEKKRKELEDLLRKKDQDEIDFAKREVISSALRREGISEDSLQVALKTIDLNKVMYDKDLKRCIGADDLAKEIANDAAYKPLFTKRSPAPNSSPPNINVTRDLSQLLEGFSKMSEKDKLKFITTLK